MDVLRCVVERITFQNEENGYTILQCKAQRHHTLITVVGLIPSVTVGSVLDLKGSWKHDNTYGTQFSVQSFEETLPATIEGLEKYLGSGLIKGIGPAFAKKIVQTFKQDTLDVIESNCTRLLEIRGIGAVRVQQIQESWQAQKEIKNIMLFLQSYGVSTSCATKIFKTYGARSIEIVKNNPYTLADDIWGIGFKTADTIASNLGLAKDASVRLKSGLLYTLKTHSENGHCFTGIDQLCKETATMLQVAIEKVQSVATEMACSEDVCIEDDAIFLPHFYAAEKGVAQKLHTLVSLPRKKKIDSSCVQRILNKAKSDGFFYDEVQIDAIKTAVNSKVMVLTGGPGTGKTTTILGIIQAYQASGFKIACAAPTGRAAKRMSETTALQAKTIHRLLEFKPPQGYQKNAGNVLDADVLILDECSMIDIILMYNLLKAVGDDMTIIMVGDTDQLSSVGAGNVLNDIIASALVPVVHLKRIFRQGEGSRIITNAHRINQGKNIEFNNSKDSDFFFLESKTAEEALDTVLDLVSKRLVKYYHVDPIRDIQVLTPMQRSIIGVMNLNKMMQETLNPSLPTNEKPSLNRSGNIYRLHDKVMQIQNNYDKEVFNGDIGIITAIDREEQSATITFDDHEVVYEKTDLEEIVLAYATTIHKAQGSEYPIVVIPVMMTHLVMLQRNLLYTAATRAKKALVLVGEKRAISYAIKNDKSEQRNTRLCMRLQSHVKY